MINIISSFTRRICDKSFSTLIPKGVDSIHASQMSSLNDLLIQVDANDNVIGPLNKLEGHLPEAINNKVLHRAFSVFMFSRDSHKLLIQKRASTKIAFPNEWANTCCSHPLYVSADMENRNGDQVGIKRAASRRMTQELGIASLDPSLLSFKEKIVYAQLSPGGLFGESEVDYILLSSAGKLEVNPNPDEVSEFAWISPGDEKDRVGPLKAFLDSETLKGFPPTPWFNLMVNDSECLEYWWDKIITDGEYLKRENSSNKVRNFLV